MNTPDKYIDIDKVIKAKNEKLHRWLPGFALRYIKRIVHEDDINEVMANVGHLNGLEFARGTLEQLHTRVEVRGAENIPTEGGCIIASNHPLGGLDGIALMSAVGEVRSDMKFLVNDILLNIKNFEPLFLPVNKHGSNPRQALQLIEEAYASDEVTLVFPAGLVSRKIDGKVQDLEWKKSFIAKAIKHKQNVIPAYVDGRNSNFFYNLSRLRTKLGVKANIEMFYLADELFRQRGKTIVINFGKPIPFPTFDESRSQDEWAAYVRSKVYEMATLNN